MNTSKSKILLFVVNDLRFFLSHRLPIGIRAIEAGYDVHVATNDDDGVDILETSGFTHHKTGLSRSGKNPFVELLGVIRLYKLFKRLRPSLIHLVTIKPVLYGGLAARLAGVPAVVSAVSGLGYLFIDQDRRNQTIVKRIVLFLYKMALNHHNQRIIFQNRSDRDYLIHLLKIDSHKTKLIRGSGVDIGEFAVEPAQNQEVAVVMISRLLKDKGVSEFVAAANILKKQGIAATFRLIGEPDMDNPASIDEATFKRWQQENVVECTGHRNDIPTQLKNADIVVLPSYREGLPKVLVEAAASGRAVVTTDVPGCRDAIEPGVSGLLVPPRDPVALANALERLIADSSLRQSLGDAGRKFAQKEFRIELIVGKHLDIYEELTSPRCAA